MYFLRSFATESSTIRSCCNIRICDSSAQQVYVTHVSCRSRFLRVYATTRCSSFCLQMLLQLTGEVNKFDSDMFDSDMIVSLEFVLSSAY